MSLETGASIQESELGRPKIEDYKRKIEITGSPDEYPSVEISEVTKKIFPDFIDSIEKAGESEGPIIVAVVRCWNKDEKSISEMIDKVDDIKKSLPGLQGVILSINYDQDGEVDKKKPKIENMTENSLVGVIKQRETSVPILPLRINKYSWTSGLNVGVALMNEIAKEKNINTEKIRMLNMSFDVNVEKEEVEKMKRLADEQKYVFTVRKTSEDISPFKLNQNQLWEKFKTIMKEPMNSNLFELVYAMRNTFGLISLKDLVDFGGFNPLCNGQKRLLPGGKNFSIKGMEDSEFYMRLFLDAFKKGKIKTIREFKKSLNNQVFYNDPSWQRMGEVNRFKKISDETDALNKVASNLAESITDSGINRIPVEQQDFRIN